MNTSNCGDISSRAEILREWDDFLNKYMYMCNGDEYHATENAKGFTNLGTAVNNMCFDVILPRLTSPDIWFCDTSLLQYREGFGIMKLRKTLADVMTKFLNTHDAIDPEDVFCITGVTSCIDLLMHCIADPNDVVLAPTPIYSRIYTDFKQRSGVDMFPIPIITENDTDSFAQLTLEKVKSAYEEAINKKLNVRGIFIVNPSNPLGDIYSPDLMMDILKFCHEKNVHAIIDEVYALSTYTGEHFESVLQFPVLPNPNKTHVLYGISKDFGIGGLRIGAIHTKDKTLQHCLKQLSFYQNIPFPVMEIAARYLEDQDWLEKYISLNQKRLTDNYGIYSDRLKKMGLTVRTSKAGFFIWVYFGSVCGLDSFEQETHFFEYLINEHRVYIVPGKELFCAQPGWFRLTFSAYPDHVDEGLNRIEKAMKHYKSMNI